jgi:hypothetical protein
VGDEEERSKDINPAYKWVKAAQNSHHFEEINHEIAGSWWNAVV